MHARFGWDGLRVIRSRRRYLEFAVVAQRMRGIRAVNWFADGYKRLREIPPPISFSTTALRFAALMGWSNEIAIWHLRFIWFGLVRV